jgi:hypothetical protein
MNNKGLNLQITIGASEHKLFAMANRYPILTPEILQDRKALKKYFGKTLVKMLEEVIDQLESDEEYVKNNP